MEVGRVEGRVTREVPRICLGERLFSPRRSPIDHGIKDGILYNYQQYLIRSSCAPSRIF